MEACRAAALVHAAHASECSCPAPTALARAQLTRALRGPARPGPARRTPSSFLVALVLLLTLVVHVLLTCSRRRCCVQRLTCSSGGRCVICVGTRRFCAACRLAKCLQVGMKREYIFRGTRTLHRCLPSSPLPLLLPFSGPGPLLPFYVPC